MGRRSKTSLALIGVLAVVSGACAAADQPTAIDLGARTAATTAQAPVQSQAPAATAPTDSASTEPASTEPASTEPASTEPAGTEPAATEAPRQRPEGPDAADFELALGGPGGTFSLSAETRPVFMVFWAEW